MEKLTNSVVPESRPLRSRRRRREWPFCKFLIRAVKALSAACEASSSDTGIPFKVMVVSHLRNDSSSSTTTNSKLSFHMRSARLSCRVFGARMTFVHHS